MKICTPVSHLFADEDLAKSIINYSDCLEGRPGMINYTHKKIEVFHCDVIEPHKPDLDIEYLKKVISIHKNLKLITFHCASTTLKPKLNKEGYWIDGEPLLENEMIENFSKNIKLIKNIIGNDIKIAIENNNYYPSNSYETITDAKFISRLVNENDIYFLFDIAHAKVTCFNKNINYKRYIEELPLNKCIQVHVCEEGYVKNLAKDLHNFPTRNTIDEVYNLCKQYSNIEYVTIEYYKDINDLQMTLNYINLLK